MLKTEQRKTKDLGTIEDIARLASEHGHRSPGEILLLTSTLLNVSAHLWEKINAAIPEEELTVENLMGVLSVLRNKTCGEIGAKDVAKVIVQWLSFLARDITDIVNGYARVLVEHRTIDLYHDLPGVAVFDQCHNRLFELLKNLDVHHVGTVTSPNYSHDTPLHLTVSDKQRLIEVVEAIYERSKSQGKTVAFAQLLWNRGLIDQRAVDHYNSTTQYETGSKSETCKKETLRAFALAKIAGLDPLEILRVYEGHERR
ncbi:MAG: hypothetical protein PHW75_00120 [Patescibacteria group bacterium]|nr:hypothetical protein [Patescibacteria group bacterium]